MDTNKREWDFEKLVGIIRQLHEELATQPENSGGKEVSVDQNLKT